MRRTFTIALAASVMFFIVACLTVVHPMLYFSFWISTLTWVGAGITLLVRRTRSRRLA